MSITPSGISTGNIHIHQLANQAKNNFLSKLFYILFMLIGVQLTYADSATFTFLYGSGIESMDYQKTFNYDTSDINSVVIAATSSQLNITVGKKFKSNHDEANEFNTFYGTDNKMGLSTSNDSAADTDVFLEGGLKINGAWVATDFGLAHEYKNHDWWVATTYGSRVSSTSTQFTLKEIYGPNYYCLSQNGTNYKVIVTAGECNASPINYPVYFIYDGQEFNDHTNLPESVQSVVFQPITSQEYGQVENIVNYTEESKTTLVFTAAPLYSAYLANDFNSLVHANGHSNSGCAVDSTDVYDFQLHAQGMVCGPDPKQLDFYVEGHLLINNIAVTPLYGSHTEPTTFIFAHGQNRWWLAALNAPFDYYGSGGWGNNNHFSASFFMDNEHQSYGFKATADNVFEVKYLGIAEVY